MQSGYCSLYWEEQCLGFTQHRPHGAPELFLLCDSGSTCRDCYSQAAGERTEAQSGNTHCLRDEWVRTVRPRIAGN